MKTRVTWYRSPCWKAGLSNECNAVGQSRQPRAPGPRRGPKPDIVSAPHGPHGPKRKHGVTLPTITNGLLLSPTEVRTL